MIGLVGSLLLLRYLKPDDYGEVTAAQIVTLTAFGVTSLGVGTYLLSNRELSRAQVFHATCWFLSTGVAALALIWAASGPIGAWLQAPGMARYMPFFVLAALLDRILFFPERMMIRKLRFRWTSLSRAFGELTYTGLSLLLAMLGWGAAAIAWANLARSVLRFVSIVPAVHWREWAEPHRLEMRLLRPIIRAGAGISVASIAAFLMRRADNLLVSRYFGTATMGTYNYAYNLADTPATAIGEQLSDVVAAAFPHAEGAKRQAALVRASTMTALIMFPLAFGLGAVSHTVSQAFFDRKWAGIGPMLMYLSILSAPRPMAGIVGSYLYADHRIRAVVWLEWLSFGALIAAIAAFGTGMAGTEAFGASAILWTCGAVGAVFVLRTLAYFWVVKRIDGVPLRRFLVPMIRPLVVCIAMVAAIFAVRPQLGELSPRLRLLIEIAIGAAVYLAGALLVFRDLAAEAIDMVRSAMSRRKR